MSLFQRIKDRRSGVLGRDCKGCPLRAGDMVEPAPGVKATPVMQSVMTAVGRYPRQGTNALELVTADGVEGFVTHPAGLMKIHDAEGWKGSWEDIGSATGWTPRDLMLEEREES